MKSTTSLAARQYRLREWAGQICECNNRPKQVRMAKVSCLEVNINQVCLRVTQDSIVETAKANNIKPYDYLEYLLTEIPKHLDENDRHFCEELLPWSEKLPANCRK